jgi:hypothetical protein
VRICGVIEAQAVRNQISLENTGLHDIYFCVFARRSHFLVLKFKVVFLPFSVLALAKAGPDSNPDGGSLSVTCKAKKGLNFWCINVSLDGKLKRFVFIILIYF